MILQLSQLHMKQDAVIQQVADKDSNIVNRAADDLVGLYYFLCNSLLCFVYNSVFYVCVLCLHFFLDTSTTNVNFKSYLI